MGNFLAGFKPLILSDHPLITWIPPLLLAALVAWLLVPLYRRAQERKREDELVSRLGGEVLKEVVLDDGMDNFVFIDRLVLTPKGILVVSLLRNRGAIFGGEGIDLWAQVLGRKTFRFHNPLKQNEEWLLTVRYHAPKVEVKGLVLFLEECEFPKGKPEGVMTLQELQTLPPVGMEEVPAPLMQVWAHLREESERDAAIHSSELALLRPEDSSHGRLIGASLLLLAGVVWAGWHLVL